MVRGKQCIAFIAVILIMVFTGAILDCKLNKNDISSSDEEATPDVSDYTPQDREKSDSFTKEMNTSLSAVQNNLSGDGEDGVLYVTGISDTVSLLKEPSCFSEVLTNIQCGEKVTLLQTDDGDGYTYVSCQSKGIYGYIDSNYLVSDKYAVCSGEDYSISVNDSVIFSEANENSDWVCILNEGDSVKVLAKTSGGLWRIKSQYNAVGYIQVCNLSATAEKWELGDDNVISDSLQSSVNVDNKSVGSNMSLEESVNNAQAAAGGSWSVYVYVPGTGECLSTNENSMQSASLIKLYIMGCIYEDYDVLSAANGSLDSLLYQMITVSDNSAANTLVSILGGGDYSVGMQAVNNYCNEHGFYNTSMNRLMLQPNTYGDNYTSTGDCGRFLCMLYNGEIPHSDEMISLLKQQTRTTKIPAGVPYGVMTANKTGELDYVQNDAAIVYGDTPYIICVMSENLSSSEMAVQSIADISKWVYEYVD